ncbi:hypothetical protein ABW19_dt0201959 [Dactylella cylindrospora]|nr:hypothetical protein ABW19_dt0201959 [Dactylella cylindrospora]
MTVHSLFCRWHLFFFLLAGILVLGICSPLLNLRLAPNYPTPGTRDVTHSLVPSNGDRVTLSNLPTSRQRKRDADIIANTSSTTLSKSFPAPTGGSPDLGTGHSWNGTEWRGAGWYGESEDVVVQVTEESMRRLVFEAVDEMMESHLAPDEKSQNHGKTVYPGALPDLAEEVAICMVIRNQHEDLQEFLTHHYHHLGVRRFYIMDDGSVPALSNHQDYPIPRSTITFYYFTPSERPGSGRMQFKAYDTCHQQFGNRHKWLGFLDADEYLEITRSPGMSMAQFLRDYERYGALGVSWLTHNSNNRLHKSPVGNRKGYTSCIYDGEESDNRHVKSFVQTKYYVEPTSPHSFRLNGSMVTVGENGDVVPYAFRTPITRDKIALHHYAVKSREDYEEKMARGTPTDHRKDDDWCECIHPFPKIS